MNRPPIPVISLAVGAFLTAILGGRFSMESGEIRPDDNLLASLFSAAPFAGHCLIFLFFLGPLVHAVFGKKVIHVPSIKISGWLAILAGLLSISIVWSAFISVSVLNFVEWAMMIGSFYAVTGNVGKKQSSWILGGWFAGISVVALMGLREYGEIKGIDPSWRIFAGQLNPNQAGALLASGIILGLPLALGADRIPRLLIILGMLVQGLALFLTQSKGALICLPIGLVAMTIGFTTLKPVKIGTAVFAVVAVLGILGGLGLAAQSAGKTQGKNGAAPMSRFANANESATQSAGFRKLLWQSAVDLSRERIQGWGIGTFQFESTRPGRVTQTALAHQTFLQLAAEATILAPISLLAFLVSVVWLGLKGARSLPESSRLNLISAIGCLCVAVAHNFIDSDMYVSNLGLLVFTLCGTVCASSADSQSPEVIFRIPKAAVGAAIALFVPLAISLSVAELNRAVGRGHLLNGNVTEAANSARSAIGITIADGAGYALLARATGERVAWENAAQYAPSPKNFRALAAAQLKSGDYRGASNSYFKALSRDPNNALALLAYMRAADANNDKELAQDLAKRLIETERTTYFTVRSQPEFIPTQTLFARLYLAESKPADAAGLLSEAIKGFARYRDITVPVVKRALDVDPNAAIAGEDRNTVLDNLAKAAQACKDLSELQPNGEPKGYLESEATRFEAAASGLIK